MLNMCGIKIRLNEKQNYLDRTSTTETLRQETPVAKADFIIKRDSGTAVFLQILWNIYIIEHLETPASDY